MASITPRPAVVRPGPSWLVWLVLALLLAVAVFFRLWQLDGVPPGLHYDEAIDLRQALNVRAGARPLYVGEGWGREALFYYLVAVVLSIVDDHLIALRLAAVLCSLGTILTAYWLVNRFAGRAAGIWTVGWYAVSYWTVSTSRVGVRNVTLPLLLGLACMAFWWAYDSQSKPAGRQNSMARFALAGAALGLTFYTYQPARFVPLLFLGFFTYLLLFHRPVFRQKAPGLMLFLLVAGVVALPLVSAILRAGPAEADRAWTIEPLTRLADGDPGLVLANGLATLKMFTFSGDPLIAYNIPGRPVFVPVWTGLFFYAGLILALWRWRRPVYAFVLIWLVVMLAPTILTTSAPHFNRTIAAQTPVFFLAALPLAEASTWLTGHFGRWAMAGPLGLAVLALVLTGRTTWVDYFQRWPDDVLVSVQYNQAVTEIADYLETSDDSRPVLINSRNIEDADPYILSTLLSRDELPVRWVDTGQAFVLPANGEDRGLRLILAERTYLDGDLSALVRAPGQPSASQASFDVYEIPPFAWPEGEANGARYLRPDQPWPADPEQEAAVVGFPVSFDGQLQIAGLHWPGGRELEPGATLTVLSSWRILQDGRPASLAFFVHVLDEQGQIVAQQDGLGYPPHIWQAGDRFVQVHHLALNPELPAGSYWLQIGLYRRETGERWPILDDAGHPAGDRLLLGQILVRH